MACWPRIRPPWVKRPGVERQEAKHLDADAVSAVLRAALALRWDRVDLDGGAVKIAATIGRVGDRLLITEPKTERSRRSVPLNPAVVAMLRRHATTQKEDRLRAGSEWVDSGLVFTNEFGGPVEPRNLLRVIEVASKAAGVEGIGVHTLRHSAAVAWLEAGVHIKAVADLLGHSSIAITGDVYGHSSEDTARAAVDGLAGRPGL
jgi:integrase